ncbi:MAG: SDR family NAD(P)-dependent oxidoreductase [Janthinobacterium lividum]
MRSLEPEGSAIVIGAGGGIGAALVSALLETPAFSSVWALSRAGGLGRDGKLRYGHIDVGDELSIAAAAEHLSNEMASGAGPVRLVIVATGTLHGQGLQPEKSYRALDADALMQSYRINAIGPALVAKHMLPLLTRPGRNVFAALSARVGSIGDNRSGGWHSYRASKAALNMILLNLAIETRRRAPETLVVGLHPGTVDSGLSRPFQRGVAEDRLFTPAFSAERLLAVIDGLGVEDNGRVLDWSGQVVPP